MELGAVVSTELGEPRGMGMDSLSGTTWTKKNNFCQVIIHALQFLVCIRTRCLKNRPSRPADLEIISLQHTWFRSGRVEVEDVVECPL